MDVLLLDGALDDDRTVDDALEALRRAFGARGATVHVRTLRTVRVAWCQGCFECWTHTPGTCRIDDAGRDLSDAWVASDIAVLVTPSSFGGWSSECKKMLDRTLGTLLPFFRRLEGEVHHWPRYASPPSFGVLAVLDRADADVERTLRTLAERNALNIAAPRHAVAVLTRDAAAAAIAAAAESLAGALCGSGEDDAPRVVDVDAALPELSLADDVVPPSRALLLVGSAKPTGTSTSERLGTYLMERLAMRGVDGVVRYVHRDAHSERGLGELLSDIRRSDLLLISTPLYFDAFPALVTRAMEAIAADRQGHHGAPPLTVAAIVNCGFPESRHTAVARTIAGLFAAAAGARWAGALQLGGGGVISGRPLEEAGAVVAHLPAALDEAAAALAAGRAIDARTRATVARPLMPVPLYMAAGDAGWLWTAAHEGTLTKLWRRPADRSDGLRPA